jgi:hypothetical protein
MIIEKLIESDCIPNALPLEQAVLGAVMFDIHAIF